MDSLHHRKLLFSSWNVRGLGDEDKCHLVRDSVASALPSVMCFQESKLSHLDAAKARSFLPATLADFAVVDANGSRGGLVTAWDGRMLSLSNTIARVFSLTTTLSSTTTDLSLTVTNVYAPADHSLTSQFVDEMLALLPLVSGPWIILGDFNLIRHPSEKNNANFNQNLADAFNAIINAMALFELPLLDRRFTWSNGQQDPVLARLDRAFFNHEWDVTFPDSALTSRPRPTSDHVPLLVTAATNIPASSTFRFENSWLLDPLFLPSTLPARDADVHARDAAAALAAKVKRYRFAAKGWKRAHRFTPYTENNCKFLLSLLDFFEESRPLSGPERALRAAARETLALAIKKNAAHWKQRGKFRAVKEGDENTKFFHARATQRFRRNGIRALLIDGVEVVDHHGKAEALRVFYAELLGRARPTAWAFDLDALYDGAPRVDGQALIAPFDDKEIKAAIWGMDQNSAPGPDGLGPSFYRAA
ncbi:uncharacterized protein [Lolium perenne]|uniref:uncharacterized protein n=1 Tax=Lolium perenne TaxID=4522 RepID=UPI003A990A34